jgi:ferric-dicitrate binding protein FerR (iron transport regulator)
MVAASMAGIIILGYGLKGTWSHLLHPVKMVEVITANGMRQQIELPDGSRIWMEGNSSLSYPEVFNGAERIVSFSGEAFFEVAPDQAHPFIINTALISTKVLGTSFNIEAYGENKAEVVVVTGKVMVHATDQAEEKEVSRQLILGQNQKATYDSSIKTFDVKDAPEALDYQQRKSGKFVYKGASITDIIKDLRRAYNTPIAISKALSGCTFYGDFNTADSVEKALNLIAITLNAKVEKLAEGKGYVISGGSCH